MTDASPWMPQSPCGPGCVPSPDRAARAAFARQCVRAGAVLFLLALGVATAVVLPLLRGRAREWVVRGWFRALLVALGVRLKVLDARGVRAPARPSPRRGRAAAGELVVANHVSWLDVVVLQAMRPGRVLAKSEVRSWPLLGALARGAGTLFVDRDRLRSLPDAVTRVREALVAGASVVAFPEGTTWCGRASGRHRPAVFQAAVEARAMVNPYALRFVLGGQPTARAAFVGEASLWSSVREVIGVRGLAVEVRALPNLDAGAVGDRRELARRTERAVTAVTASRVPPPDPETRRECAQRG